MKTPEQMAKEYADYFMPGEDNKAYTSLIKEIAFLAGYKAAKDQLADGGNDKSDATLHYQYIAAQTTSKKTSEQLVAIYTDELCEELAKSGINPNKRGAIFRIEDMRMAFLTGCKRAVQLGVAKDTNSIDTSNANNSNGWISVKERLPEEGFENVIVLVWRASWHDYDTVRWTSCGFDDVNPETITHWMPLPNAPKEEK